MLSGGEKIGPWFNVRSKAALTGPATFIGGALYLCDVNSQVSKVKLDRMGSVIWRFMLGEPLTAPPVVIDGKFYATNSVGNLINANDETGAPIWDHVTPRVKSILGGTKERLFCRSLTDRLLVVDTQSGEIVAETAAAVIGQDFVNQLDDRLYLISAGGTIQCARQSGKEYVLPFFHEPLPPATEKEKPKKVEEAAATETPMEGEAAADPFGAGGGTEPMAPGNRLIHSLCQPRQQVEVRSSPLIALGRRALVPGSRSDLLDLTQNSVTENFMSLNPHTLPTALSFPIANARQPSRAFRHSSRSFASKARCDCSMNSLAQ